MQTNSNVPPDLKRAILEGEHPIGMTLESLTKTRALPIDFI